LDGNKSLYLKCIYENAGRPKKAPITEINFFRIKNYQEDNRVLVKPDSDIIEPIPISTYPNVPSFAIERATAGKTKRNILIYKGEYDLTYLLNTERKHDSCLVSLRVENSVCVVRERMEVIQYVM
jgi:hypothetical protein